MPDSIAIPAEQGRSIGPGDKIVVRVPVSPLPDQAAKESERFAGAVNLGGALWRLRIGSLSFSAMFPFSRGRVLLSEPARVFPPVLRGRVAIEHSGAHVRAWDVPAGREADLSGMRLAESWCCRFALVIQTSWICSLASIATPDLHCTGVDSRQAFAESWNGLWGAKKEWAFESKPIVWAIEGVVEPT